MMESGFSIQTDELPAYEVELINLVKAKINEREQQENVKLKEQMNGV